MAIQSRIALFAAAKQSGKGSPAADPDYEMGVTGGAVHGAAIDEGDRNPTAVSRVLDERERTMVVPGMSFDGFALPKSIGLLLSAVCGAKSTSGTGPYTHTFTPASDLPYLTTFSRYGDEYYEVHDAKVNSLGFEFDGTGAVSISAAIQGLDLVFNDTTAYTATNSERSTEAVRGAGGTFQLDGAVADIQSGSVTVENNLTPIPLARSVTPDDLFPGMVAVSFSLAVVVANSDEWRHIVTGSDSGTSIANTPRFASTSLKWVNDANEDLAFDASRAAVMAEFLEANPDGGPATLAVEGVVVQPSSGDEFSFTLNNSEDGSLY